MLLRVTPDLSEIVVCAEQAEQENILGASRGTAEPLEVWRCENPVLLTDTARIAQLEPGLRDAVLALYESYPRTVSYDGTSVTWSPTECPKVWAATIDTLFFARTLRRHLDGVHSYADVGWRLRLPHEVCTDAGARHRARLRLRHQSRRHPLHF